MFAAIKLFFAGAQVYVYAGIFAAFVGLLAFAHHTIYTQGKEAGAASQAKLTAKALATVAVDEKLIRDYGDTVTRMNAALHVEQDKAAAQQVVADKAVKAASANASDADKTLAAWITKYAAALRSPACATLLAQICPAAMGY